MPPTSQNLFLISNSRVYSCFTNTNSTTLEFPNFSLSLPHKQFAEPLHSVFLKTKFVSWSNTTLRRPVRAFESDIGVRKSDGVDNINLDVFLSIVEILCLCTSAVISVGFAVNSTISSSQKPFFAWQFVLLVGAVVIGASIRRRQWRRICAGVAKTGGSGVDFVGRIEKLEDGLRSSATMIKFFSRQLEKLGIRFRVTRKTLKEPIAEAAALAQKNSEAIRAVAVKEDVLEKELAEIQMLLLAMQEQQQKLLDLVLAIAQSGNLLNKKQGMKEAIETRKPDENVVKGAEPSQTLFQALASQKESQQWKA